MLPSTLAAIDAVVKASIILAATSAAAVLLRRAAASTRHLLWTLGLIGALAIPALSVSIPRWHVPILTLQGTQQPTHVLAATSTFLPSGISARASRFSAPDATAVPSAPSVTRSSKPRGTWPLTAIVLLVWLGGALFIVARLLLGLALVRMMTRRARQVTQATWLPQARAIAEAFGLRRVRFARGRAASMPMACGIFRPVVLVPVDANAWPDERLRVVLLHELAHVKRRDCLTHAIAQIACAIYWFNPLVWIAARRLRTERERACDDLVLRAGTRGTEYADQLLQIARVMHAGRFPAILGGATLAMAHRSQLEGRLMAILDPNLTRRGLSRVRAITAVAAAVFIVFALASVQPWAQTPTRDGDRPLTSASLDGLVSPAQSQGDTTRPSVEPRHRRSDTHDEQLSAHELRNHIRESIHEALSTNGALDAEDVGQIADSIRQSIHAGIGSGVGTGVGVGADIASNVVSTVVQSVANGIATGLSGGVTTGVTNGIVGGITDGVNGMVNGITSAVQDAVETATDPRTIAALIKALDDSDKDVRETAVLALARKHDPHAYQPLTTALGDSSAEIRAYAAFSLGQLRDPRAIGPLSAALRDSDAEVRTQAAFALGQLRDARAVDPLVGALKDTHVKVREQAAFALGQIRDPRAIDGLTVALEDSSPAVRRMAVFALGQIR